MRIGPCHRMDLVSEPGLIVLRREDGSEVARFSARGATLDEIERAAEEDRRSQRKDLLASDSIPDVRVGGRMVR
jgi:hypothetical protein